MRLSAADLGTEEVQMEKRLMKWLDRATIWGAIVLIDEAEVYLEQRQSGHISRNALVTGTCCCLGRFRESSLNH